MIARKYPHLFSPLKIGSLTLKNRIEAASTSLAELSSEGYLTRDNIAYYKLKAKGAAAVVTIEFMTIGDCVKPRRVMHAIRMGYDAAMAI